MAVSGKEQVVEYAAKRREVCSNLKQMIVDQLCLDMEPGFLTDDQPLFGRGLELDSIDSLELAVGIFDNYQLSLSDDETAVFSSVNAMADYVLANAKDDSDDSASVNVSQGGFIDLDA